MMGRCYNKNHHKYRLYGALGVKVCDRWHEFTSFLADMGERPEATFIDRFPNNAGDYEKDNCRWATVDQQNNNKKTNVIIEYRGQLMTVSEAARRADNIVSGQEAAKRIKRKWSIDRALTTPVR